MALFNYSNLRDTNHYLSRIAEALERAYPVPAKRSAAKLRGPEAITTYSAEEAYDREELEEWMEEQGWSEEQKETTRRDVQAAKVFVEGR